jgi:palmitoyltransferase
MNCIGRSNYAYFIGMLLSLAVLLTYGGYVSFLLLNASLQIHASRLSQDATTGENWSARLPWGSYFDLWLWAISEDIRIGGVGMLAALTAPLAWGLFSYHVYLIWAGMTTSETSKWADWKDDIADGLVFKRKRRTRDSSGGLFDTDIEPVVNWPASNDQWLMRCDDGQPPDEEVEIFANPTRERMVSQKPDWKRVESLTEVDNLYDLGFWANIADIIPT